MARLLALLIGLSFAGTTAARAGDLVVEVRDAKGAPVREAVVTVRLAGSATPVPKPAASYVVDQQDIQFHPFVTVVPVGATVRFLNHDPVRHHVYSFSAPKRFELKLERRQDDRAVSFDKPGIVPLGCNIHDSMIAFVDVVDTPWAGKTDAQGRVVLRGLPAGGRATIEVWHPWLRAVANRVGRAVPLGPAPRREAFEVALRAPPRPAAQADY